MCEESETSAPVAVRRLRCICQSLQLLCGALNGGRRSDATRAQLDVLQSVQNASQTQYNQPSAKLRLSCVGVRQFFRLSVYAHFSLSPPPPPPLLPPSLSLLQPSGPILHPLSQSVVFAVALVQVKHIQHIPFLHTRCFACSTCVACPDNVWNDLVSPRHSQSFQTLLNFRETSVLRSSGCRRLLPVRHCLHQSLTGLCYPVLKRLLEQPEFGRATWRVSSSSG